MFVAILGLFWVALRVSNPIHSNAEGSPMEKGTTPHSPPLHMLQNLLTTNKPHHKFHLGGAEAEGLAAQTVAVVAQAQAWR